MTNMEARIYFEQKLDEMVDAMLKVQDAWFCVEDTNDGVQPYGEEYPFEADLGEVISGVMRWQSACQRENNRCKPHMKKTEYVAMTSFNMERGGTYKRVWTDDDGKRYIRERNTYICIEDLPCCGNIKRG